MPTWQKLSASHFLSHGVSFNCQLVRDTTGSGSRSIPTHDDTFQVVSPQKLYSSLGLKYPLQVRDKLTRKITITIKKKMLCRKVPDDGCGEVRLTRVRPSGSQVGCVDRSL